MSDDLDALKGLIVPSVDYFWQVVCHPLIIAMNTVLNKEIGSKETRVGVFGPYPETGQEIILKIARMVSGLGYNAITGSGTYLQYKPNNLVALFGLLPSHVEKIRKVIPQRILFHELPSLVSKAIFFENDERGQYEELKGCLENKVPSLGFIRHMRINAPKKCSFLVDYGTYSECTAPEPEFCLHHSKDFFCPFYDSINIPWFSKEILISKEYGNRLVAVRQLTALKKIIKDFLS